MIPCLISHWTLSSRYWQKWPEFCAKPIRSLPILLIYIIHVYLIYSNSHNDQKWYRQRVKANRSDLSWNIPLVGSAFPQIGKLCCCFGRRFDGAHAGQNDLIKSFDALPSTINCWQAIRNRLQSSWFKFNAFYCVVRVKLSSRQFNGVSYWRIKKKKWWHRLTVEPQWINTGPCVTSVDHEVSNGCGICFDSVWRNNNS